jgi:plastocyanin
MKAIQSRAAALLLAMLLVGGCAPGGGSSGAATAPAASTTTAGAASRNVDFGAPLTVAPGAVVMVTNMDNAAHTVTADQGSAFDVDVRGGGGTATFTAPPAPGTYAYHCTYHPNMHGTLTVK